MLIQRPRVIRPSDAATVTARNGSALRRGFGSTAFASFAIQFVYNPGKKSTFSLHKLYCKYESDEEGK